MRTIGVISMLHESPQGHSAQRLFRSEPVLWWTLRRLGQCRALGAVAVLCWEDQLRGVEPIAADCKAFVLAKGPRVSLPQVEAVSASRRWSDGWRSGLGATCAFDRGFYAPWISEIAAKLDGQSVVAIDPAAGLVDPRIVDDLVAHARAKGHCELVFAPAAPGLGAALVKRPLLERLVATKGHPGRQLHYWPDVHAKDPIAMDACAPVPTVAARTTHNFLLDSDRRVGALERATISLNGQLIKSHAEELVARMSGGERCDPLPRDVTLELVTERATSPIYWAGRYMKIDRRVMGIEPIRALMAELSAADDIRLTLGGMGDPLLSPVLLQTIEAAHDAGIRAIHVETDLLPRDESLLGQLAAAPIDVMSVHMPAATPQTYAEVMGVDALSRVIENLKALLSRRAELGRLTPLVAPTFTKCAANLGEMEAWYDQWLRAAGCAVIVGPSDCAGQMPDVGVADMSPPRRRPCVRLESRMTILCDGTMVACEQDVLGRAALGRVGEHGIGEVWGLCMRGMREDHAAGRWTKHALCAECRDWHRP